MSLRRVVYVLDEFSRIVLDVNREQAERMVRLGQARWTQQHTKQAVRLAPHYELADDGGRTRTSRGPVMGAIGRSQRYTFDDARGRVSGFKHLDSVDWHVFNAATLDCMAVKA